MCGIVGYAGSANAKSRVIDGLKRPEYRGYDSAGIALPVNGRIEIRKSAGDIANLENIVNDDGKNLKFPARGSETRIIIWQADTNKKGGAMYAA